MWPKYEKTQNIDLQVKIMLHTNLKFVKPIECGTASDVRMGVGVEI